MLVQFLRGIPRDMEEAAMIDGCNPLQLLIHIIVPLLKPAIVSVIPGARSIAEVEENVTLLERPIPVGLWAELKDAGLLDPAAPTPGTRP